MDDLVEWLRAQLDEDEEDGANRHAFGCTAFDPAYEEPPRDADLTDANACSCSARRVLREVEAKRRIVDEYAATKRLIELTDGAAEDHHALRYRRFTVQVLALPYRYRPGYRGEWRV